jgi:ATP-dependent Zn protease
MDELSAYHEAGHAFCAVYLGARVRSVSLAPEADDGPARYADIRIEWPTRKFDERERRAKSAWVALAGPVAEMLYRGERLHPGFVPEWASDWQLAWEAAADQFPQERRRLAHLERATAELYEVLDREPCWSAVAAIADHLLAYETLEGDQVAEIVQEWFG